MIHRREEKQKEQGSGSNQVLPLSKSCSTTTGCIPSITLYFGRIRRRSRAAVDTAYMHIAMMIAIVIFIVCLLNKCNAFLSTRATSGPTRVHVKSMFMSSTLLDGDTKSKLSSSTPTTTTLSTDSNPKSTKSAVVQSSSSWYPTKIQQEIDYRNVVQALYLRHIVLERMEMAQLVMEQLMSRTTIASSLELLDQPSNEDVFGRLANQVSACLVTKNDGGIVGWIDIDPAIIISHNKQETAANNIYHTILPVDVVQKLIQYQPKSGDIHIVESTTTNQVHICKVEELWLRSTRIIPHFIETRMDDGSSSDDALQTTAAVTTSSKPILIGSHSGVNVLLPRSKLKGKGVIPKTPTFVKNKNAIQEQPPQSSRRGTYIIHTNGCQMNVADSERLEGILQHDLGLENIFNCVISEPLNDNDNGIHHGSNRKQTQTPDVVIVNTCSIRDHAEQKLYHLLGPYRARKRNLQNNIAIVVTGCVAQQEGIALLQKMPEIDVVLGPQYVPFLATVLEQLQQGHQMVVTAPMLVPDNYSPSTIATTETNDSVEIGRKIGNTTATSTTTVSPPSSTLLDIHDDDFSTKPIRGHTVRAWVNAILGCNEHCTYCVVPATRGMEQSRSMESILEECLDLISNSGYKEVTLLGQNIDAYGRDMVPKRTFADLLHYLNAHLSHHPCRIRYVTSHPRYFSDRVIEAVATLDTVCECFHMPFQAGDDQVLQRMKRGYTYDSYLHIIDKIRTVAPDAAITADVIVGFPGETEAAFQRTLDLMEAVKFDNLNSFMYSPRPNTQAAILWEEDENFRVPLEVKRERLQRVHKLAAQHALEKSQRYLNRTVEVLVEGTNPRNPIHQVMGRTRQGRQVYFDGNIDQLMGAFVNAEIVEARTWSLLGKMIEPTVLLR